MEFRFMTIPLWLVTPLGACSFLGFLFFLGPVGPLGLSLWGGSQKILLISLWFVG